MAINFYVDDTAQPGLADRELQWKGQVQSTPTTRKIAQDATWGGPLAPLWTTARG
ncbi:MAG: hypothetical protein IPO09_04485 [Anaeromyxobacter sp.]|nr:hypothetical protein [Anaeromyxobacter sp.]